MRKVHFVDRFQKIITSKGIIKRGQKIIIGFSGGADSTALVYALSSIKSELNLTLLCVHVNYHLRGDESNRDEQFVKDFCYRNNLSLVIKNAPLDKGIANLENEARNIRMKYFYELKKQYKMDKILLAHHKVDQAETVLYRFIRGAAFTGLSGIREQEKDIVHPLLSFTKEELIQALQEANIKWCEDSTNKELIYQRNIVRNELIPLIKEKMNPNIIDRLYDYAEMYADTDEYFRALIQKKVKKAIEQENENETWYNLESILQLQPFLRFYFYRYAYTARTNDEKGFYSIHSKSIDAILQSKGSKSVELPMNVRVRKEYSSLVFEQMGVSNYNEERTKEIDSIRTFLTFENKRLSMAKMKTIPDPKMLSSEKNTIYIDLDKVEFPLLMRHRIEGDRFIPFGMSHSKKLKDFFIDEKVSKFERDSIVVIEDKNRRIIWIAGYRMDNRVSITNETKNILMLKIEEMGQQRSRSAERKTK